MKFRIGIENNNDDRTIAWALEHPGCFAYAGNSEQAQNNFPAAARDYVAWVASHGESWLDDEIDVSVEETFEAYFINSSFERLEHGEDTYMVESFFVHDLHELENGGVAINRFAPQAFMNILHSRRAFIPQNLKDF